MPETFTSFFRRCGRERFDAILFDIDGTLSSGVRPLPGARELLLMLEAEHFPYILLTNDSCNSHEEKAAILRGGNIPVTAERIYSCGDVLKYWKKESRYNGELLFQCGKLGNPSYAVQADINVTTDPARLPECKGVIFGEGAYDWQPALEGVFNFFLANPQAPLIVVNPDSYWPSCTHSGMGIGSGAQARFICAVLKDAGIIVEPLYIGKPYPPIYQGIMAELTELLSKKILPERIAMVGDSLASDIKGANANKLCSCLVLSGITTPELAAQATGERRPEMIFSGV